MNEKKPTDTPKKRGRKPLGGTAMTPAERQKRRRELLRSEGDKHYLLRLNELYQEYVEILAKSQGVRGTTALQDLVEASLIHQIGIMNRCERLREMGATDGMIAAFIHKHHLPALPDINEMELPSENN